jgi:pimeloyl-ACP methyl ester carboxylesterase
VKAAEALTASCLYRGAHHVSEAVPMPRAQVNGISLHYEIEGDGPPLLLISGLGANRLSWVPAIPLLRGSFRCITFDNRGAGQSDVPPGPYTIDQMGDDAAALVESLGVGPVLAVGWSLGGSVLQSVLIRHPEVVRRAVLLNTLPSYTDIQHGWLDALLALRRAGVDQLAQGILGMPWAITPRLLADHTKAFANAQLMQQNPYPTTLAGYEAQAQAIRVYDSRPGLPSVKTPTLVLVGAEDILTPVHQSTEIAELIPGAHLVVLPRGGHAMLIEYLEDTVGAIKGFLSQG